jgi:mono/diheme cytochrome c family protein
MRRSLALTLCLLPLAGCGSDQDPPAAARAPDRGAQVYAMHCAACHQRDGRGLAGTQPSIAGSTTAVGPADELIRWVMFGDRPATLAPHRGVVVMPAFAWLSDEDLAGVLTHVRQSFGNDAPPVDPASVAAIRAVGKP